MASTFITYLLQVEKIISVTNKGFAYNSVIDSKSASKSSIAHPIADSEPVARKFVGCTQAILPDPGGLLRERT